MAKNDLCTVCNRPAEVKPLYSGSGYCKEHFRTLLEKRVRKDLRTHQPIDVSKEYVFKEDDSPASSLCLTFLRSIFGEQLRLKMDKNALPGPFVIIPSYLEEDVSHQFTLFLEKKSPFLKGIRPLRTVTLADINSLSSSTLKGAFIHPLLLALEKEQSGTFFGMSKSLEKE